MLDAVTRLLQDGRQLPVAALPPRGEQPLAVEGLELGRPLLEDAVQAGPPALDPQPGPAVQSDAAHNPRGTELAQGRQLQTGEDQAPAGRHVQELQRRGLQGVRDAQVPERHQDLQSQRPQVGQGLGEGLQRRRGHPFKHPEVFELQDPQLLEPGEQRHGLVRPVEVQPHLGDARAAEGEFGQQPLETGHLWDQSKAVCNKRHVAVVTKLRRPNRALE